jgi:hypothetical protein
MKRLSLVFLSILALASCGYDGKYRYPCQDPENWESSECQPPVCKVDGACTETLLGWDPNAATETTIEETVAP